MSKTQSIQPEASLSVDEDGVVREPDDLARRLRDTVHYTLGRPDDEWSQVAPDELAGHCYQVCEAYYHGVSSERRAQLTPQQVSWTVEHFMFEDGEVEVSHWFLKHDDGTIIDPTAEQFEGMATTVPYDEATGRGFVPPSPSKQSQKLLDIVQSR